MTLTKVEAFTEVLHYDKEVEDSIELPEEEPKQESDAKSEH